MRVPSLVLAGDLGAAYERRDGYIMCATGQDPKKWAANSWWFTQYDKNPKQKAKALYWREHAARVWDCNGLAEGIYKDHTGVDINTKARYNYAQWCGVKGSGVIPAKYRVPGAAVFWSSEPSSNPAASNIHHVAYLYKPVVEGKPEGDWYLIEARGVMYGVVKTTLLSRKPNFWGLMTKYFDYEATKAIETPTVIETTFVDRQLGDRLLKNGCEGEDVKEMQEGLIRLGYDCGKWGADGDFGDATEMAVRRFQIHSGLAVDGIFGPKSLAALQAALVALETPVETEPHYVVIEGGNCYIRMEPNTGADIRGVAHEGSKLPYAGETSEEGWPKVIYRDKPGWVSGKYGRVIVV